MTTNNICFCGEIRKNIYFLVENSAFSEAVDHLNVEYQKSVVHRLFRLSLL